MAWPENPTELKAILAVRGCHRDAERATVKEQEAGPGEQGPGVEEEKGKMEEEEVQEAVEKEEVEEVEVEEDEEEEEEEEKERVVERWGEEEEDHLHFEAEGSIVRWVAVDFHGVLEVKHWLDRPSLRCLQEEGYRVWVVSFASHRWRKRQIWEAVNNLREEGLVDYLTITSARTGPEGKTRWLLRKGVRVLFDDNWHIIKQARSAGVDTYHIGVQHGSYWHLRDAVRSFLDKRKREQQHSAQQLLCCWVVLAKRKTQWSLTKGPSRFNSTAVLDKRAACEELASLTKGFR